MSRIRDEITRSYPSLTIRGSVERELSDSRLMAELARYVVDCFESAEFESVRQAFELAESLITTGSESEAHAAVIGFLETIQNVASHRKCGSAAFEGFLSPSSRIQWVRLNEIWQGKESLAEVVAAETGASLERRWWQFWKKRKKRTPHEMLSGVQNPELRKIIEQMTRE